MTTARNVLPPLVTGTWCPRDKGTTKFNQKNAKSEHIEAQTSHVIYQHNMGFGLYLGLLEC